MPVVELVIPELSEASARAATQACADAACWPLRLVRRGWVRRSWQLELVDVDHGVFVADPPARSRVAATIRELSRWFARVDLVPAAPASRLDVVACTPTEFAEEVCASGLDPAHRYVVSCPPSARPRRLAPSVHGADVLDAAWERVERWLVAHHPLGVDALRPGASSEALDPSWSPALRRSLKRHDGQAAEAGALAEGLTLLSATEVRASGCFAAGPDRCLLVDESDRVVTAEGAAEAPSLESWLHRWADELEAGEQAADDAGDIVLRGA